MTLREVFHSPPNDDDGDWLFLPGNDSEWSLETQAFFPDLDDETGVPNIEPQYTSLGLKETLDLGTIESVVLWADRLVGKADDEVRFESFLYYYRFDAFLPKVGAPDPPPADVIMRNLDLQFYDGLGAERGEKPCSEPGCQRGSVKFSVLCRPHHFENVRKKKCPFDH
ncbi:MAG: hypothetical protein NTY98_10875 [Verrucomicrobia bacterium]|nr:hypothetical protein [Verrucomicrobiota bacterium]